MICTITIASALILGPIAPMPKRNSIDFWDQKIRVTERVLDRSICSDIERVQAMNIEGWDKLTENQKNDRIIRAKLRMERQREGMERHCRKSPRVGAAKHNECNLN